jgi:hypothetical protein
MELNNIHLHIILYAKGHYPVTKDIIKDLKMVIGYFSWMELEYVSKTDVLHLVAGVYQETHIKNYPQMGLHDLFGNIFNFWRKKDDSVSITELVNGMLSGIRHVEVKYLPTPFPTKDSILVRIMDNMPEVLPAFHNFEKKV